MIAPRSIQVIIPALNEAKSLPGVLERLRLLGFSRIRVVDNGSRDGTAEVARAAGAEVLHETVRGYGQACWTGMQALPEEVEWVLFCDADGSDALEELPELLRAADEGGGADMVLGNRAATPAGRAVMSPPQRWGNRLATFLIWLGWGHRYRDLGPMRLVRRAALDRISMEDRGFGWTIEMQLRAVELGLGIREVPVAYHRRRAGVSKISGTVRGVVGAGLVILATWLKFFLRKAAVQACLRVASALLLLVGAAAWVPSGDFARNGVLPWFWWGAGFLSAGYVVSWLLRSVSWVWVLGLGLLLRGVLLWMFPGDDVWRYLWEGRILNAGFNPYVLPPSAVELEFLRTPWWSLIQHREITAIYPPLTQALMRLAAMGTGWWLLKGMVVAADLAVVVVLIRRFGTVAASRYAFCPLVLLVFAGGAHFDVWMILAMVGAWIFWDAGRWRWAALAMGTACGIKYVAVPLLAWMAWRVGRTRGPVALVAWIGLALLPTILALCFIPRPWEWTHWVPRDFALYARSADFIPRLLAALWEPSVRMNAIYLFPVAGVAIWVVLRARSLVEAGQGWFLGLLAFSPLVHAWYFTWALPFAAVTGHWGWRFTGMAALVYFQLQQTAFDRQEWLLTWSQWALLWTPLLAGSIWVHWQQRHRTEQVI
jgi:glycosyltransferase involved in cell wall biosynthesis